MLSPEKARDALQSLQVEGHRPRQVAALRKLPKEPREVGLALLALGPDGKPPALPDWDARQAWHARVCDRFDALDPGARRSIWRATLPRLEDAIERALALRARLPYLTGWNRRAFRAPSDPSLTAEARATLAQAVLHALSPYDPDLGFVAAWAGHINSNVHGLAYLLAAAIDRGGDEGAAVLATLRESGAGTHEVGVPGEHVTRALLCASDPEGWAHVERMLLAARRQEGLRQGIVEAIDEAHPAAFRRMLRLILDENLARFASIARAVDVWFGFLLGPENPRAIGETLRLALALLEDPASRDEALASDDPHAVALALWAIAFEDVRSAIEPAALLLDHAWPTHRYVAARALVQFGVPRLARPALRRALDDDDLRVALKASEAFLDAPGRGEPDAFDALEALVARMPARPQYLEPIVWDWERLPANRSDRSRALVANLGDRPISALRPHLAYLPPWDLAGPIDRLATLDAWDEPTRETMFALLLNANDAVREAAARGLARFRLDPGDAPRVEASLTRKASNVRRTLIGFLAALPDVEALASAERLLKARNPRQRHAGLEILRALVESGRAPDVCRGLAGSFAASAKSIDADERRQLDAIRADARATPTLDDGLGLFDPSGRTRPTPPKAPSRPVQTPTALRLIRALDALVAEHAEAAIAVETWQGKVETLLGNAQHQFPEPKADVPVDRDAERLPLREVWESWWAARPDPLRDPDGLELARALVQPTTPSDDDPAFVLDDSPAPVAPPRPTFDALLGAPPKPPLAHPWVVRRLLGWLFRLHPPEGAPALLIDGVAASFAAAPPIGKAAEGEDADWRASYRSPYLTWLAQARTARNLDPSAWTADDHARLFGLLRWLDEPSPGVARSRPLLIEAVDALDAGAASEADLYDHLLGPGDDDHRDLRWITTPQFRGHIPERVRSHPAVRAAVDRIVARVLKVELARGETPTAATAAALAIGRLRGAATVVRLLHALGKLPLVRGYIWKGRDRATVFSHLLRAAHPGDDDTPGSFAALARDAGIPEDRLLDLAVYAPHWARFVAEALRWPELPEAVWWLHAHAKDNSWTFDAETRALWNAEIAAHTDLAADDLLEGAVDVAWFHRVHEAVGPGRWSRLDESARYASSSGGHKRAQLYADAMLGKAKKADLLGRIKQKRNLDAVRALGLVPLARGQRLERDVLDRYEVLQEFLRTGRGFGPQRRASEARAASIALQNLARTAGYPDPTRLEWAMEAEAVADLADGPVVARAGEVEVALTLDDRGRPEVAASRAGRPLKAVPPAAKKDRKVAALLARRDDVKRQASRMRQALEGAMVRGDAFTGDELRGLAAHPVLRPMLGRLVLIGEGIAGYPDAGGRALRDPAGRLEPVKPGEALRLAHPLDLLEGGAWHDWRRESFAAERVQPFKQVFRELYVPTEAERAGGPLSRRYAGHQVNPRQALALLGARGWVAHPEEGVRRTFHDERLVASLGFLGGAFTPAEVEPPTLETVAFSRKGERTPIPLADVPPRLFSEVMRDLDLVVSVAHAGGVGPEASASTVAVRSALLGETCALLGLHNVRLQGHHALIDGQLGRYGVHLGSGVVHRRPGGALCLVPVHAQHRGRIFLPFADDDPKAAEVLAKVLLLARDEEIRDPALLGQIRAGG
jgi:hypothetical protein